VRLAWIHARADTVQLIRIPAYSVPTLAFPAVLLLLFGRQLEEGEPQRLLVGFAATAVLAVTFFQFGVGIATNRLFAWDAYVRTLPVGPGTRLAGRVLSALAFALATVAIVTIIGLAVYDATMPLERFVAALAALLLGSIPFGLLGIALGYWVPPRAAVPIANLAFLPIAIAGSLWQRPPDLPPAADAAAQLVPTRSWIEVLDPIATGDGSVPLHHVAALVLWGVLFAALAAWGYRRDEGERFT
jgi:ABC-2 type transport system permease protein